jgi:hypothetical protein
LIALTGWSVAASADNGPRGPAEIVDTFIELTMKSEHSVGSPAGLLPLTRWEKPVTWTLLGSAPTEVVKGIDATLHRGVELAGGKLRTTYVEPHVLRPIGTSFALVDVPIRNGIGVNVNLYLDSANDERPIVVTYLSRSRVVSAAANLAVLYGDRGFLAKIARVLPGQPKGLGDDIEKGAADCVAYTWTAGKASDIAHTLIVVSDNLQPDVLDRCLWEEVGQVLGIRNDLVHASFSIFTNELAGKPRRWTAFDEGVIRMLYDPALRVGMTADQVRAVAPALVKRYFGDEPK